MTTSTQNLNRLPIIADTTRTVTIESDVVEINGVERTIWAIVTRCPVNGVSVSGDYFASREEAAEAWAACA